ncbi:LamG-like jellyroll fold domain-containing protein [Pontibacter sp. G13]|uniref:LamG-like jellyroll fold domain-containing protein n=1 Tax=Pontibacter sp. G13 TaxID=3074898 RepID=UPI00288967FE|nr:LamG-like jellyroll fold domain-containing protein [Pontibacter sp. G13]WNJ19486.1 LamG-like jellyroll fold domain-containing protein [Pontibacter sp. G13]
MKTLVTKRPLRWLLCLGLLVQASFLQAQTYTPKILITFDDDVPIDGDPTDLSKYGEINTEKKVKPQGNGENLLPGAVGSYHRTDFSDGIAGSRLQSTGLFSEFSNVGREGLTVEWLFKPEDYTDFQMYLGDSYRITISENIVNTLVYQGVDGESSASTGILKITMDGIGGLSIGDLMDGDWHHLAITYDAPTGVLQLYVDGLTGNGMRVVNPNKEKIQAWEGNLIIGSSSMYSKGYQGGVDEIAIYDQALSASMIYQHYVESIQNGMHYTHSPNAAIALPKPMDSYDYSLNPYDFDDVNYPTVQATTVDLLYGYQHARYAQNHTLPTITPWTPDIGNISAVKWEYVTTTQGSGWKIVQNSTNNQNQYGQELTLELAQHYNYKLFMGGLKGYNLNSSGVLTKPMFSGFIQNANNHSDLERFFITLWKEVDTPNIRKRNWDEVANPGGPHTETYPLSPYEAYYYYDDVNNSNIPPDLNDYIRSGKNFVWNPIGPWRFLLSACSGTSDSLNVLQCDGQFYRDKLDIVFGQLNIDRIDAIGENGEVIPKGLRTYKDSNGDLRFFQQSLNDGFDYWFQSNTASDIYGYMSDIQTEMRAFYADRFVEYANTFTLAASGGTKTTEFFWYSISGNNASLVDDYHYGRDINTVEGGHRRSTPYYYPQSPRRWDFHGGALSGFERVSKGRVQELRSEDLRMNPFVSPGFSDGTYYKAVDKNIIRPGQYLGILKGLAMLGADTYTNFMFNGYSKDSVGFVNAPVYDANWRTWKLVMPAYAQAVTSRWEEFLDDGELMEEGGRWGMMKTTSLANAEETSLDVVAFRYNSGSQNNLIYVRKMNNSEDYLVFGTSQKLTNAQTLGRNDKMATIEIANQEITFPIRLQGSTYKLDLNDLANPVFYQLDAWHEWKAPAHWCEDFCFDAEVYDFATPSTDNIKTETLVGLGSTDFSEFTSYTDSSDQSMEYNFRTNKASPCDDYRLWVRCRRATSGQDALTGTIGNDVVTLSTISTSWTWITNTQAGFSLCGDTDYVLTIDAEGYEIDKILVTSNTSLKYHQTASADFVLPDSICVNEDFTLSDSLNSGQGNCADVEWYFGDGTIKYGNTVTHSYSQPGTYDVIMRVRDNCKVEVLMTTKTIVVTGPDVDASLEDVVVVCPMTPFDLSATHNGISGSWHTDPNLVVDPLDDTKAQITIDEDQYFYFTSVSSQGCAYTDSVLAIVSETQEEFEVQYDNVLEEFVLDASGAYAYEWSIVADPSGDLQIDDNTNPHTTAALMDPATYSIVDGIYQFSLTVYGGNPNCSTTYVIDVEIVGGSSNKTFPTSVEEDLEEEVPSLFKIYPNPAEDVMFIESDLTKLPVGKPMEYAVINSMGQTVLSGTLGKSGSHQINCGDLSQGVYFVKIHSSDHSYLQTESVLIQ